ncbi:hypothetical protein D3C75_1214050 [compost metagenome]
MSIAAVLRSNFPRLFKVIVQHVLDLVSEAAVDRQQGDFEVQAEGAVVQVGTANRADIVIHQHHLLMQEARLVAEHAHTRTYRFEGEKAGGGIDDAMVWA